MTSSKKHATRARSVQDLGQGELGLQDRQVIAIAGSTVLGRERMGQTCQPLAQQGVDLGGGQTVAELLQSLGVGTAQNAVVQGFESNRLPWSSCRFTYSWPLMHSLALSGKVGAELEEERAEIVVDGIEVELVDHGRGFDDPGVLLAGLLLVRFSVRKTVAFSCALPTEQDPFATLKTAAVLCGDIVLALAFAEDGPPGCCSARRKLQPDEGTPW